MKIFSLLFLALTLVELPAHAISACGPPQCNYDPEPSPPPPAPPRPSLTRSGIALEKEWQRQLYQYALRNIEHPSWGVNHAERNYHTALSLAAKENISIDRDVLFAAAFVHDMGGLAPFSSDGVDHAVRSAELAEPLLAQVGFPMAKFPAVREMILGHTYYGPAPAGAAAKAFRDADVLDFLGAVGVARIFAATQDKASKGNMRVSFETLQRFAEGRTLRCLLAECDRIAEGRLSFLKVFLEQFKAETLNGRVP